MDLPLKGLIPHGICDILPSMPRIYFLAAFILTASYAPAAEEWKPGSKPRAIPAGMFVTDPSLEVTLWATTPQLFNPTNMDIDHAGRV